MKKEHEGGCCVSFKELELDYDLVRGCIGEQEREERESKLKIARWMGGAFVIYHVITLSAIGEAETPAGGSVCILLKSLLMMRVSRMLASNKFHPQRRSQAKPVSRKHSVGSSLPHETSASGSRHF